MNKIATSMIVGLLIAHSTAFAQKQFDASTSAASSTTKPDNSKRNKLDETNRATTAQNQSNEATDINVTKKIRQKVVADDSLSTYAHNIKIVTVDGHVTLNGVVRSELEKSAVQNKALEVVSQTKLSNELKVAPKED